jgi:hypothetical protein
MRILMILASTISLIALAQPAKSEDVAALQIQSLWAKMATIPDLVDVDQIIIEGDAGRPAIWGVLQKRGWIAGEAGTREKRFFTRFERACHLPSPECFRVTGIWSTGNLISEPPFPRASRPIEAAIPTPLSSFSGALPRPQ